MYDEYKGASLDDVLDAFLVHSDDELMHYGTKGMKRGQHDPNKRWQSHAVYAQGKPNPNGRVGAMNPDAFKNALGGNRKDEWYKNPSDRRMSNSMYAEYLKDPKALNREIERKSSQELKDAAARLRAENEFRRELNTSYDLQAAYMRNHGADRKRAIDKLFGFGKMAWNSVPLKLARNAALVQGWKYVQEKYDKDTANALFGGIIKVGKK